jgi:FHA domain
VPEVVYLVIKLSFVALLWLFVLLCARAVRMDLFGRRSPARAARPVATPRPARAQRSRGKAPSRLVVSEGSLAGTTLSLGAAPITIGRAPDSTLVLTDDYASNKHARLVPRDGQWFVEDLGSTNGTYLDRTRVSAPTSVPVGTPVRIGKTVLVLRP